ncbi:secreted RxLR effector protein 161-like [Nicotiana tabacum]|uniref:Secreted RxLR effector protein 161-like n=1 Tax=Nicotiana tabacum TaxID=4097 RepID=A0AC58SEJ1_TOBAC
MNENTKSVSTPLAPYFKLSASMSPKNEAERDVGLIFEQQDSQYLVGCCDSDYAGDLDKHRSTTSYVFTFANTPVSWKSTSQLTVSLSTTEAEYMTITEAVKEAIWLQGLLRELGIG